MACDICGKTGTSLEPLLSSYKTADIKAVCPECEKIVNKHLIKLRTFTNGFMITWLKIFMKKRRNNKQ